MMMNKKRLVMIILKTKLHHQVKRLKVNRVVNQVKKPKIIIKKPKMKLVIIIIHLESIFFHFIFSGTGEDDNAENEGESPTKKAKGKPGRKPGQTNKNTANKDTDQEVENGNHL